MCQTKQEQENTRRKASYDLAKLFWLCCNALVLFCVCALSLARALSLSLYVKFLFRNLKSVYYFFVVVLFVS